MNLFQSQEFRVGASTIQQNFDYIGFPCILIYKGGVEIANLTPITLMFDTKARKKYDCTNFSFLDVATVLENICQ